ncbi:MAG: sugar phosphate nucleotidyltransferase [Thermodesulfobacteriota bacterium]
MTRSPRPWKALVLAAGFGTRLLPYTRYVPKPLFTIAEEAVLDIIIRRLAEAGCGGAVVNTHHLHERIERHCAGRSYEIPVRLSYEPEILGTGGAMKNNAGFFGDAAFLVVNSDIVTDIDLAAVYRFHLEHAHAVTMVMHDCDRFNSVAVEDNRVVRFYRAADERPADACLMAFTGIHVVSPRVLDNIPGPGVNVDIIDIYKQMLERGQTIGAMIVTGHQWQDIGTPDAYRAVAFREMARRAAGIAFGDETVTAVEPIAPDGSDTCWFRITAPRGSLIACQRGIRPTDAAGEADAFTHINRHLFDKGIAVPRLWLSDPLAGISFLEDLGDVSLQAAVRSAADPAEVSRLYRLVIEQLLALALDGADGFDDAWTYQTPAYDREVIIERECRYFEKEFMNGYLGLDTGGLNLEPEYRSLADLTLDFAVAGLVHRDMQSRNIMIRDGQPYFIDVQGARRGPVQYDLAALLIDPYVNLSTDVQTRLLEEYEAGLTARQTVDRDMFRKGYACCAVTRNLQALGAFGFLTREKGKKQFEPHIPAAVASLVRNLSAMETITERRFPELTAAAVRVQEALGVRAAFRPPS